MARKTDGHSAKLGLSTMKVRRKGRSSGTLTRSNERHVPLRIARDAAPFILLQRTQLQSKNLRRLFDMARLRYVPHGLYFEGWLRRGSIERAYTREIEADYLDIKPFLPVTAKSIMDIGCGISALSALLFQHYQTQMPSLHLVDRSQMSDEVYFGFQRQAAFYNSLQQARKTLIINDVPNDRIHTIEAPLHGRLVNVGPLDLVISLLAWGFHFPVSTYLEAVCQFLTRDGRVIIDVRRNTDGLDALGKHFSKVSVISETPKACRVCAQALRGLQ